MKRICVLLLFLIVILVSNECLANDYSREANYIYNNKVKIERIKNFLYSEKHNKEEKEYVARTLIRYTSKEAISFMIELLNDNDPNIQAITAMVLMNTNEFDKGLCKFKELIVSNQSAVMCDFYIKNEMGEFAENKLQVYHNNRKVFTTFFMDICSSQNISYMMKLGAARTLYCLGNKDIPKRIYHEILEKIPSPRSSEIDSLSQEEKHQLWLRNCAIDHLKKDYKEK